MGIHVQEILLLYKSVDRVETAQGFTQEIRGKESCHKQLLIKSYSMDLEEVAGVSQRVTQLYSRISCAEATALLLEAGLGTRSHTTEVTAGAAYNSAVHANFEVDDGRGVVVTIIHTDLESFAIAAKHVVNSKISKRLHVRKVQPEGTIFAALAMHPTEEFGCDVD